MEITLGLGLNERATLADHLLESLDELSEDEAEKLWAEEAQRRVEEYRAGKTEAIPAEEVHRQIEESLQ